ncbi:gastrula zinc finger protein XlCGF46.1-like isoform X1 [Spodoptera litura]|uniref:Gastrula zinc finger protein XlCGF46.1-like isoform X1 n=1 Tax=Spodoptera litura TaxID=69820 RepID=A0A9J7J3Y1_SPOLT|nr:gastrula zinc finger protein XlCGF46.1-like isoform X1 [Spodoptera litura]XP_022836116.1 gastrula zinc finger protein XlCGF46.1-like isoform X1 [Spodoptera litura]XP_022836117.1 gastrula zinc finger protein XlCGF46.1-like isoform X1 [Spodoptera litura]
MTESLEDSFERCCRLCAEEQDVTIMIFSQEAEAMLLQNKLNRYLLIEVDEDDKLPKNICIQCCTKLQSVCDFIDTARKAQEVLLQRSFMIDQIAPTKCMISLVKTEQKVESAEIVENEKYTEMEVSVDPMMVLQNSEVTLSPAYDNNVNDVTYLHGLDTENVTIKLIKKGDTHSILEDNAKEKLPSVSSGSHNSDDDDKVKPFKCTSCERSFCTDLALKNHSWIHLPENRDEKQYTCNTCSEGFYYKYDLISHLKKHRSNGVCQLCGRMFRSEKTYVAHMYVHLPSSKSYTCKICGRSYNTWGGLKTHSVSHSAERPYKCDICKKTFKRNQDLKFHVNQHTGAKPYKCPFCDKCFASSGNSYSHRNRMHPGEKYERSVRRTIPTADVPVLRPIAPKPKPADVPTHNNMTTVNGVLKFKCHLCEHSFMKKENFNYHMYQHTGEKPYKCTNCTEKFVTRRGLLIHHDNKHPGLNRPLGLISKNSLLK